MNFFLFRRRHTYVIDRPYDQVQTRLKWIITRRWDDLSMDLIGKLNKDGQFNLTSKWGLTNIKWIENNPAYINGKLVPDDIGTNISITTKPNTLLLVLFYVALVLFAVELMNLETVIQLQKKIKIGFPAALGFVLLLLIVLFSNGLKRRFEQLMQIE
jgi:hypothetical protein